MSYACRINFCQWFWRADLIQNLNHTSKRSTDTKQMLCPEHNRGKANHCHCIPQVIILTCLLHFHATFTYKVGILLMTIYMGYYVSNYVEVFLIQKKYYAERNYFRCTSFYIHKILCTTELFLMPIYFLFTYTQERNDRGNKKN